MDTDRPLDTPDRTPRPLELRPTEPATVTVDTAGAFVRGEYVAVLGKPGWWRVLAVDDLPDGVTLTLEPAAEGDG